MVQLGESSVLRELGCGETVRLKSPILRHPPPGKTVSAELLAPGLAIGAAFESAYPVAKGNYYDIEALALSRSTYY